MATSCSYQASLQGFAEAGYSKDQAIGFMQKSVALACQARDEYEQAHPSTQKKLVALSIGCYGAVLANGAEYTGDYGHVSIEDLVKFHTERIQIFLSTREQVDMIIFETIPSFLEAQAISKIATSIKLPPVAVAFQCRSQDQIADGTPIVKALEAVKTKAIFATGINCTKPEFVQVLLETVHRYHDEEKTGQALIAYPDGGESWDAVGRQWDSTSRLPEEAFGCMMAQCIKEYGPRVLVGGCCGTGPNHIKSIIVSRKE